MRVSTAARNAWLNTLNTTIGTNAVLKAYTGSIPATPETAATGVLLFTMALTTPSPLAAASGAVAAFNAIADATAAASGTVGYVRIETSGGTGVLDFPASELTLPGTGAVSSGTAVDNLSLSASVPLGA